MHSNTISSAEAPVAGSMPWGAVLSMSLCSFALVASEFMPVSLLTPLAADLTLTEGQAGQAISISGIFAVIASLAIASVIGKLDRKPVLLSLTGLMIASGTLVALAPNYLTLMAGRAMLGVAIGGCWAMSTAVMIRIAPENQVPRAIAVLQGGSALATAVAAPLGSFLGSIVGWRGAFFCVVPLAALALLWQTATLPALPGDKPRVGAGNPFRLLARPKVSVGLAAVALLFMGQFALYTYLRPFLETVTAVDVSTLSLLLLLIGAAGLAGTMLVGSVLGRDVYRTLFVIPLLMAAIASGLTVFGSWLAGTAVLLGLWGLVATAAPVGWFTWLSRTLPNEAEAGGGLIVATIQFAITIGATIGGIMYDASGYRAAFWAASAILALSAVATIAAARIRS